MDIRTTIIILLVLLVSILSTAFLGWLFGTLLVFIFRQILKIKTVQQVLLVIKKRGRIWWEQNKQAVESLWDALHEIIIEPLALAYAIFVLFNRLSFLTDYTTQHPEIKFWQLLNYDMERNVSLYFGFFIIFSIWMIGKGRIHRQHQKEQKAITKSLETSSIVLIAIAKKLGVTDNELGINPKEQQKSVDTKEQKGI